MAELNLDYYTAKDHYSDGDIEETLLKMAQEGKSFEDLPEEEVSFPMVYHFSGLRENILSWYPLKKADSVLEIVSDIALAHGRTYRHRCSCIIFMTLSEFIHGSVDHPYLWSIAVGDRNLKSGFDQICDYF